MSLRLTHVVAVQSECQFQHMTGYLSPFSESSFLRFWCGTRRVGYGKWQLLSSKSSSSPTSSAPNARVGFQLCRFVAEGPLSPSAKTSWSLLHLPNNVSMLECSICRLSCVSWTPCPSCCSSCLDNLIPGFQFSAVLSRLILQPALREAVPGSFVIQVDAA